MTNGKLNYKNVCLLVDNDGDLISVLECKTLSADKIKELKEKSNINVVKIKNRFNMIDELENRVNKLEKEIAYLRGEISEEEYKGGE